MTDSVSGASIHATVNPNSAFLFNDQGELIQARLDPSGYEEISRTKLIEPTSLFGSRKFAWSAPLLLIKMFMLEVIGNLFAFLWRRIRIGLKNVGGSSEFMRRQRRSSPSVSGARNGVGRRVVAGT